jgi:hypothetical protein
VGGCTSFQISLRCVWALCLLFVTISLMGAPLSNSLCLAFGHPAFFFRYNSSCGCPSFKLTLHCAWVPILVQAILKKLSRSQNFSLSCIWLVFFPSAPLCGPFHAFHMDGRTYCQLTLHCIWAFYLIFVMFPLVGTHLADSPCIAFGHPTLFSLRFLIWVPLLKNHLVFAIKQTKQNF